MSAEPAELDRLGSGTGAPLERRAKLDEPVDGDGQSRPVRSIPRLEKHWEKATFKGQGEIIRWGPHSA